MRQTIMEVDCKAFLENIKNIENYVKDKKLMPVIKANAYGTYINKKLDLLNNFDIVAVAMIDEAIDLRKIGYKKEIFILNQPYIDDIKDIMKYNVTIGISDESFLDEIIENKYKVKVHLEIETGMNRTGIKLEKLNEYIDKIKSYSKIKVEGVYTHLSSADYDEEYTNRQLYTFQKAVEIVNENFDTIKYIHSSASNGLINYDDGVSNLVRPGIIMYGYKSFDEVTDKIDLKPICKLKTKIVFIKNIDKDTSISYSRRFISKNKMKIATIPIGYADGLRRDLFDKGEVIVNGQKTKIVGTICMDSCMIDVTGIENVEVGTDVYLWDNELITVDDIAKKCNTINYEILTTITYRVSRQFN